MKRRKERLASTEGATAKREKERLTAMKRRKEPAIK